MMLKRILILVLTITATAIQVKSQNAALRKEVAYLTDSIGSRYPGSSGDLMARRHIATQFSRFGLECKEYPFDIIEYLWCDGSLQIQKDTIIHDFIQDEDFYINGRSAEGMVSSRFVVVGNSLPDSLLEEIRDRIRCQPAGKHTKLHLEDSNDKRCHQSRGTCDDLRQSSRKKNQ